MLFWDTKDESAWGLALAGLIVVTMAALLGEVTGNVQPKAPVEMTHPETSSPDLQHHVVSPPVHPGAESPYPQPGK